MTQCIALLIPCSDDRKDQDHYGSLWTVAARNLEYVDHNVTDSKEGTKYGS